MKHKPNKYSAKLRLLVILCSAFVLAYCVAQLAIGYTYIPTRRGGILLSGVSTLFIAFSSMLFCTAGVSLLVDHYDERDNEALYRRARAWMLKVGLGFLVLAPVLELLLAIMFISAGHEPLTYRGFAADATLYDPALAGYRESVAALSGHPVLIVVLVLTLLLAAIAWLSAKYRIPGMKGFQGLTAVALMGVVSVMCLLGAIEDFVAGEVSLSRSGAVYTALDHPAQFNAILLTKSMAATVSLLFSAAGLVVLVWKGPAVFAGHELEKD